MKERKALRIDAYNQGACEYHDADIYHKTGKEYFNETFKQD